MGLKKGLKVKVTPISLEAETKKGAFIYLGVINDQEDGQIVVKFYTTKKLEINKPCDLVVTFGQLWFVK